MSKPKPAAAAPRARARAPRKAAPPPARKLDPQAYNELVAQANLHGLRLTGTRFDIRPHALAEERDRWAYRITDALKDWNLDSEALVLRGIYDYTAECVEGRRKPVALTATYLATWRLSATCEEHAALAFLQRVGRFSCYPYFRALFGILTEQSGLLLPPLPVISEQPRRVTAD
jgi:hypothetical protein